MLGSSSPPRFCRLLPPWPIPFRRCWRGGSAPPKAAAFDGAQRDRDLCRFGVVTALSLAGIDAEADAHASIRFPVQSVDSGQAPSILSSWRFAASSPPSASSSSVKATPRQGQSRPAVRICRPAVEHPLGYLFFASVPDATMIVGAAAIATAGFYTLQQGKARATN